jgi:glycosyltransferase Alg8
LRADPEKLPVERGGIGWPGQFLAAVLMGVGILFLIEQANFHAALDSSRFVWWPIIEERTSWIPWIPVSILVAWRWCWVLIHWTRAAIYRFSTFPRLRREAEAAFATAPVPELAVLAVTYKEEPTITASVFRSVFEEIARVEGLERRPVVVAVTGCDADDDGIKAARDEVAARVPADRLAELVLLRGSEGKRRALASGLEWIKGWQTRPDGAFVCMDGDTQLEPGVISRSLCFFRIEPPIAAMTTNEHVVVQGPGWISEWLHLRHGLRDLYASSISLSRKLLCLTGRYSMFRADALDAGFIEIVRADHVQSWLWGDYALLSGDDKSTWFHLLSQGRRMLYLPDVSVVTHELVRGNAFIRAYHNLRRWGGNMIRNSERAISLGPSKLGLFTWWCLVDQRISMWTVLVGPLAVVMMGISGRWDVACAYMLWVIFSRNLRVSPAWLHARRLSIVYAPLSAFLDWAGALIKIWVVFFPAKQFWFNRGHRELDSTAQKQKILERRFAAGGLMASAVLCLVAFVAWLTGTVQVDRDLAIMLDELRNNPTGRAVVLGMITLLVGAAVVIAARFRQGVNDNG